MCVSVCKCVCKCVQVCMCVVYICVVCVFAYACVHVATLGDLSLMYGFWPLISASFSVVSITCVSDCLRLSAHLVCDGSLHRVTGIQEKQEQELAKIVVIHRILYQ